MYTYKPCYRWLGWILLVSGLSSLSLSSCGTSVRWYGGIAVDKGSAGAETLPTPGPWADAERCLVVVLLLLLLLLTSSRSGKTLLRHVGHVAFSCNQGSTHYRYEGKWRVIKHWIVEVATIRVKSGESLDNKIYKILTSLWNTCLHLNTLDSSPIIISLRHIGHVLSSPSSWSNSAVKGTTGSALISAVDAP